MNCCSKKKTSTHEAQFIAIKTQNNTAIQVNPYTGAEEPVITSNYLNLDNIVAIVVELKTEKTKKTEYNPYLASINYIQPSYTHTATLNRNDYIFIQDIRNQGMSVMLITHEQDPSLYRSFVVLTIEDDINDDLIKLIRLKDTGTIPMTALDPNHADHQKYMPNITTR